MKSIWVKLLPYASVLALAGSFVFSMAGSSAGSIISYSAAFIFAGIYCFKLDRYERRAE